MKVAFDVAEYYYLPQYEPVIERLAELGYRSYLLTPEKNQPLIKKYLIKQSFSENVTVEFYVDNSQQAELIREAKFDWVIFGNYIQRVDSIPTETKYALIQHGVGPKACYYEVSDGDFDIRFVEGAERLKKLQTLYPEKFFLDVGFVKLDPLLQNTQDVIKLSELGLSEKKKTILYAPSFFPCSIEMLPDDLPEQLANYNIILKPHYFSLVREKFSGQKAKLEKWAQASNAYLVPVEDTNILPYYAISDLMISEASSTVFEFIALDKPIIWFTQTKLRWSYRGIFAYRLKKRMDYDLRDFYSIGAVANNFSELKSVIAAEIENPERYSQQRKQYCEKLIGLVDGKVSQRIVDYLLAVK